MRALVKAVVLCLCKACDLCDLVVRESSCSESRMDGAGQVRDLWRNLLTARLVLAPAANAEGLVDSCALVLRISPDL